MYADFAELIKGLTGHYFSWLSLLKTFGFMLAISFLLAGYTLYLEFVRREKLGYLQSTIKEVQYGAKVQWYSYAIQALIGALIGYKLLGMFQNLTIASQDPMNFLTNAKGSWLGALIGAAVGLFFRYDTAKRYANNGVFEIKKERFHPYMRVGDMALLAALFGFAGAKVFNAFESWNQFIQDPIQNLISSSGLTFYGGLICATIALFIASKKWKISFKQMCDATAPGLILAYGVGRLGCQISGDGDWGIINKAYYTTPQGDALPATDTIAFAQAQADYPNYYQSEYAQFNHVPAKHVARPAALSFMPHWFFAYSYSHNVNNTGRAIQGCNGNYCSTLPSPVFPTPLYEFVACLGIFFILWRLRKKLHKPLDLFSVYLMLNGLERFAIEQIRVNHKYEWFPGKPTQAVLIALVLVSIGCCIFLYNRFAKGKVAPQASLPTHHTNQDQ